MINERKKGIAIFVAVLVSALALSVGLSLSLLVVKEIGISSNVRDSMKAFYVSETALECVKDYLSENTPDDLDSETIPCNDATPSVSYDNDTGKYELEISIGGYTGIAEIRDLSDSTQTKYEVTALGYNTADEDTYDRVVERQKVVEITKTSPQGIIDADIVVLYDTSGSLCRGFEDGKDYQECPSVYDDNGITTTGTGEDEKADANLPGGQTPYDVSPESGDNELIYLGADGKKNSEMHEMLKATATSINFLHEADSDNRVALAFFADEADVIAPLTQGASQMPPKQGEFRVPGGSTNMIKGIDESITELNTGTNNTKVIFLITDGGPTFFESSEDVFEDYRFADATNPNDPEADCSAESDCAQAVAYRDTHEKAEEFKGQGAVNNDYLIYVVFVNENAGTVEDVEDVSVACDYDDLLTFISNESGESLQNHRGAYLRDCIATESTDESKYFFFSNNIEDLEELAKSAAASIQVKLLELK